MDDVLVFERRSGCLAPEYALGNGLRRQVTRSGHSSLHSQSIDQPLGTLRGFVLKPVRIVEPDGITNYFAKG
jgi:hypothetical protein